MEHYHPHHYDSDPNAPDPINVNANANVVVVNQVIDNQGPPPDPVQPPPQPPQQQPIVQQVVVQQQPGPAIDPNVAPDPILQEHWLKTFWRPACAWVYLLICFMDFIGFPLLSMIQPLIYHAFGVQVSYVAWLPLTLTQSGLIHMSFGAILGVSAWTRGIAKANGNQ
jgi:hypothetical protein